MRNSRVLEKFRRKEPVLITALHFTDPALFEMTSLLGFDCIWMDLEHHQYSVETAATLMRAARVGVSDIVARPAKGEFMRMGRLLESGAQGIMYPRCDNAAEAAEVVRWSKFAPIGERGFDGANADAPYCSLPIPAYIEKANQETFILIQLESPQALKHAEAIAQVPGVDAIMVGPADLSILSGVPGQFDHPIILDALQIAAHAAKKAGIVWGTTSASPDHSRRLLEMGAGFLCHGSDIGHIKRAMEQIQANFSPLGFTFANRLGETGGSCADPRS